MIEGGRREREMKTHHWMNYSTSENVFQFVELKVPKA